MQKGKEMKFPSKELLSEVFGREVSEIKNTCTDKEIVIIAYFDGFRQAFTMNIYELAFKCKEWAFDKGFVLKSYKKQGALSGTYHYAIDINENVAEWLSNTEQEAIFKACEWIMEQTKCGS